MKQRNSLKTKKTNIAILCTLSWAGGTELLRLFVTALVKKSSLNPISIKLFFHAPNPSFKSKIKLYIKKLIRYTPPTSQFLNHKQMLDYFQEISPEKITFVTYNHQDNLKQSLSDNKIDVVLPLMSPPPNDHTTPWVGYIFDFQHKYLPHLFSKEERIARDNGFLSLIKKAPAIIVNAKTVKTDIIKQFPQQDHTKIFTLPFAPIAPQNWLTYSSNTVLQKYNITNPYFIISNQFWVHKSHETAFKALKILHMQYQHTGIHLVCTGHTYDYRQPTYFDQLQKKIEQLGLTEKIHILGHIPKKDQIALLKQSIALLQPTLFEGGPGGGSTYDAVALGVPAIVSAIPVNKEISAERLFFFEKENAHGLAKKMASILEKSPTKATIEELIKIREASCEKLGIALLQAISFALVSHNKRRDLYDAKQKQS
ncbi:glycosyltransferase [Candidatus Dependentiae bacterium]|nr:glycosyltransferase [Candidatus Dependentiae bacterium]